MRYFLLLFVLLSSPAFADATVNVTPVDPISISGCVAPPANARPISIVGVDHRAGDEAVGFTKQGDRMEKVYASTDIKAVVKQSVRNALVKCGYKVDGANALRLQVSIDEFAGGARNNFLVGKGTTQVALDLELRTPDENSHYTFRYANESALKGFSTKKLKRLEKSLNDLLADVINQLAASPQFAEGVADLSKF